MADLAASDVTYALRGSGWRGINGVARQLTITFGDGALTYPSGGVPLTAASMGCPNVVFSFNMGEMTSSVNTIWKYDYTNNKLRAFVPNTGSEFSGGSTAVAAQTIKVEVVGY